MSRVLRSATRAAGAVVIVVTSLLVWAGEPARSATTTTTQSPESPPFLETFAFSDVSSGFGVFTRQSLDGSACTDYVGRTTDGGALFSPAVRVVTWDCESGDFESLLADDGLGDVFLWGPGMFVSHDDGRTWSSEPQSATVMDIDGLGRSIWMVLSLCNRAQPSAHAPCSLEVRRSSDGGRTWDTTIVTTAGASDGLASATGAKGDLVRLDRSRAYLMIVPSFTGDTHSKSVPLWYTGDGGTSWSDRHVPCRVAPYSVALAAAPDGTLMAVCASEPSAGEQRKTVLESFDGGRTWTLRTGSNIDVGYLGAIDLTSSRMAYLVGGRSSLMVTSDGGNHWHAVEPLIGSSAGGTAEVHFFDAAHGLVLGNDDGDNEKMTLWRSSNGGKSWVVVVPRMSG